MYDDSVEDSCPRLVTESKIASADHNGKGIIRRRKKGKPMQKKQGLQAIDICIRSWSMACVFAMTALAPSAIHGQEKSISDYLIKEKCQPASVGVLVKCLDNDSILASLNAESLYIPASVQKTITAAAAYEKLGAAFTFKTKVFIDGRLKPDSGVIPGNCYIRGGGDPGFLAERIWLFVQQLYLQGVRTIDGDLVLDGSYFDTTSVGPGFAEDQSSRPYESMVGSLSGSFNSAAVYYRPAGSAGIPVIVDVFPGMEGLQLASSAKCGAAGTASTVEVSSSPLPGGGTRVSLSGAMALDAKPRFEYVKTWSTAVGFGREMQSLFRKAGISLKGSVRTGAVPDSLANSEPFFVFESLPLFDFVRYMFKYSNNFAAEMLFKTLDAEANGGRNGSWEGGASRVKQWWNDSKLPGVLIVSNG
jgi:serine-type D-Ala-D-Ala carboxypeptidase/endopeptidase (penicillin-binding protein 4)